MSTASLVNAAVQALIGGGAVALMGIIFGIWDRRAKGRADNRSASREEEQELQERLDQERERLEKRAKEAEQLAAEREKQRDALLQQNGKLWSGGRRFESWAHRLRHQGNAGIMSAINYGKHIERGETVDRWGNPLVEPAELPEVPPLEQFIYNEKE